MNRRRFLLEGGLASLLAVGGTGFVFARRSYARSAMAASLLDDALPPWTTNAYRELHEYPVRAREGIKRYFHGKCLNVRAFVAHVSSSTFAERLGRCRTAEERETCLLLAFCSQIASSEEILFQVRTIATELGSEFDAAWSAYCTEVLDRWNVRIRHYGAALETSELTDRFCGRIREELLQAAREALSNNQRPALGTTIGNIGESALLLLPLVDVGPAGFQVGIPLFFLLAAKHIWNFVMARLDDRQGDYQAAISGRLASLGNWVGAEFEREIRLRSTDLHTWQERTIRETAQQLAEERVHLL